MHGLRCRGISLVELVVFIAIISTALAGILGVMSFTTRASADPLAQKQALAIAEAYLEEALAMPFTYCDPDDPLASEANSSADCATPEDLGAEGGETRSNSATPFDNVSDYASLPAGAPANADGTPIGGLGAYNVAVAVVAQALTGTSATVAATDGSGRPQSVRVTVTVTGPGTTVVLDGYRAR
jgi:MSHA pilin protein MshD